MFSVFDIFKIGLGPSSSHTTGPMRIAKKALELADASGLLEKSTRVQITLQGSLALTGIGHGTDRASIWGLLGYDPEDIDPSEAAALLERVKTQNKIALLGLHEIEFIYSRDIDLRGDQIPKLHPNGMVVRLFDENDNKIFEKVYYSTGGGFIATKEQLEKPLDDDILERAKSAKLAFSSARELLFHCRNNRKNIYDIVLLNEDEIRPRIDTKALLIKTWEAMNSSIERGLKTEGVLEGGLNVRRRAADLYKSMKRKPSQELERLFDWLNVYAMAVNEENSAGGRVVTAPTNGAAGLIPSLIRYYCAQDGYSPEDCHPKGKIGRFLLTAAGIGMIYKQRASLSGAEMGCQGEVGVACSMGAAGLCAIWGGTPEQIEHAAEIGMEHNLGLTCDPVGGLVQIPCIERNAIGAVKAANAARLALLGDGNHKVTLDQVVETMRQTGLDMSTKYKETSQGGLAVNVVEC